MGCSSSRRSFLSSQRPGSHLPWVFHLTYVLLLALASPCQVRVPPVHGRGVRSLLKRRGFRKFHSSYMWESAPPVSCCIGASRSSRYHLVGSAVPPPHPKRDSLAHPAGMSTPEKGKEHFLTPSGAPWPRLCWVLWL